MPNRFTGPNAPIRGVSPLRYPKWLHLGSSRHISRRLVGTYSPTAGKLFPVPGKSSPANRKGLHTNLVARIPYRALASVPIFRVRPPRRSGLDHERSGS